MRNIEEIFYAAHAKTQRLFHVAAIQRNLKWPKRYSAIEPVNTLPLSVLENNRIRNILELSHVKTGG